MIVNLDDLSLKTSLVEFDVNWRSYLSILYSIILYRIKDTINMTQNANSKLIIVRINNLSFFPIIIKQDLKVLVLISIKDMRVSGNNGLR